MRKMLVALIIITLIITGWRWERNSISSACDSLVEEVENIEKALPEINKKAVSTFYELWESKEKLFDTLIPHDEADKVNIYVARLKRSIETNDTLTASNVLCELKEHLKEIELKTRVHYTNIF